MVPFVHDPEVYIDSVRFDHQANIVVVATADRLFTSEFLVLSFARQDGTVRWIHNVTGPLGGDENRARAAAIDSNGDVVAVGYTDDSECEPCAAPRFTVVKLNGDTGALMWQPDLGFGAASSVAIDPFGDVIVSGGGDAGPRLLKLARHDGAFVWETTTIDGGWSRIALDAWGDIARSSFASIAKYSGVDGRLIWQRERAGDSVQVLTLPDGDVVTQDRLLNQQSLAWETHIRRRRSSDGVELWSRVYPDLVDVALGPKGDLFVGGSYPSQLPSAGFHGLRGIFVSSLEASTGAELWRSKFIGNDGPQYLLDLAAGFEDVVVHWTDAYGLLGLSARDGIEVWRVAPEVEALGGRVAVSADGKVALAGGGFVETLGEGLLVQTTDPPRPALQCDDRQPGSGNACNDGDPCTTDICAAGQCRSEPLEGPRRTQCEVQSAIAALGCPPRPVARRLGARLERIAQLSIRAEETQSPVQRRGSLRRLTREVSGYCAALRRASGRERLAPKCAGTLGRLCLVAPPPPAV